LHHRRTLSARIAARKALAPSTNAGGRISVGIMGSARSARMRAGAAPDRFRVAGWSRGPKQLKDIECFNGSGQLDAFLRRTISSSAAAADETRGTFLIASFTKLNRTSPMARRRHQCAAALAERSRPACLSRRRHVGGASLTCSRPSAAARQPVLAHPRSCDPHNAADTIPTRFRNMCAPDRTLRGGEVLENVVEPTGVLSANPTASSRGKRGPITQAAFRYGCIYRRALIDRQRVWSLLSQDDVRLIFQQGRRARP